MPNINLTDSRKRDAVVKAENTGVDEEIRYVDSEGNSAHTRKILKATVDQDYESLVKRFGDDPAKLGLALIDTDPEVDIEKSGVFLWGVSKVYVNSEDGIVYRIEQTEIVRDPFGAVKETRPRKRSVANVDADVPLTWTGRQIKKAEAAKRFLFSSKLQIVHVNGLTYDFLFGMASELAKNNALMMVGGGPRGRDPLIFRTGSIPYRGFLEGRVDGDKYILLLHLSNMELKLPEQKPVTSEVERSPKESVDDDSLAEKQVRKAPDAKEKTVVKKKSGTKKKKSVSADRKKSKAGGDKKEKKSKRTKMDKKPPGQDSKPAITSEDLGVWLKSIRMGKYLKLFVDNEIDVDVLPELTEDDLKELDIPVGSRRRLLKAVAETADLRAEVAMSVKKMAAAAGKAE